LHDDSSRIIFNNGRGPRWRPAGRSVRSIWRVTPDIGLDAIGGNNHVGLRSKSWGRIFFGRQDLHYFGRDEAT
jgi:hypothetical protein